MDTQGTTGIKSFWDGPEGNTGKVFLFLILGGICFAAYTFLPALILLLSNTLYAFLLLGAVLAVIYAALDPKVQALVGLGYKLLMRSITNFFVTIDPIGIAEEFLEDLRKNLRNMDEQGKNLQGQMVNLKTKIDVNKKEIQKNMSLAKYAKDKGQDQNLVLVKVRKGQRLSESNMTYEELYNKMELLLRVIKQMRSAAACLIEDKEDEVRVVKEKAKVMGTATKALRSAKSIIQGDPAKVQIYDLAMEKMAEDIGNQVGEMTDFMEMSADFLKSVDLQNGVYEEEGLKKLEEWSKSSSLLLGSSKVELLDAAADPHDVLDISQPLFQMAPTKGAEAAQNRYAKLLDEQHH